MKTKINGILTLLLALVVQISFAQDRTISGNVSDDSGPLPGVSVVKKGTSSGTETDFDGNFSIKASTGDILVFSFVGMKTVERAVNSSNSLKIVMTNDNVLEEVVVTGVASGTSKKKLAISAETVSEKLLKNVPGVSAGAAIQGKVAGVNVVQPSGLPGSSPSITIRGATSLFGGQNPLIIVDGVFLGSNNLSDINSEDIKSFEILKGAAAASLYGSKAANGVIQIITKRGKGASRTSVTIRNEVGISSILRGYETIDVHPYLIDPDGTYQGVDAVGGVNNAALIDNPYPRNFNNFDTAFGDGLFRTSSVSAQGGYDKGNFYVSFQDFQNDGIVKIGESDYNRRTAKVNLDFDISDKISVSTSNSFSNSKSRQPDVGQGGPLYALQFTPPHIDLSAPNEEDGSAYNWDAFSASGWPTAETNPFYYLDNYNLDLTRERLISNTTLKYKPLEWLTISGSYGLDNLNSRRNIFVDKTWLDDQQAGFVNGNIDLRSDNFRNEILQFDVTSKNTFGKLELTSRLQALQENEQFERIGINGSALENPGVNNIENVLQTNLNARSTKTQEVARSYSGILNMIYNDRYIFDGLARYEQVSAYGPLARNQWFFRAAGAYRVGLDIDVDWIDELKVRGSYGTSGLRPPLAAQFEVVDINDGNGLKESLGNSVLGPSISTETEFGFNFDFLKKFKTSFTYSNTENKDLVIPIPLAAATGFREIWLNAATIESKAIEATLGYQILNNEDSSWDVNVLFSKYEATITDFARSDLQTGPSNAFIFKPGEEYGTFYGNTFVRSFDDLPAGSNPNDFIMYKGFVVSNDGTNTAQLLKDENGVNVVKNIGNTTPDFNMSFNTSYSYKGFNIYALVDWQKGGQVYNQTKQWRFRELADPSIAGETIGFASSIYAVNQINDFFVEDASFVKLREVSLRYDFDKKLFENTFLKGLSFGISGRNLFIISDYSGIDPEVSDITDASRSSNLTSFRFDAFGYPSVKTFTGTITLKF